MFMQVQVLPLSKKVKKQARKLDLLDRLENKLKLLKADFRHPSLRTKLLRPKHRGIWQIRINQRYRAFLILHENEQDGKPQAEVIYVGDPHE